MRKLLLIPALILALSLGFSGPARAHQAAGIIAAHGNLDSTVNLPTFTATQAGGSGNTFYSVSWSAEVTGTLSGSCDATESGLIDASGNWNAHGLATCTGSINGTPGTFQFSFHNKLDPSLTLNGKFELQGTGGQLQGVSGHGTLAGTPSFYPNTTIIKGQNIIYSGQLNLGS